VHFLFLEWKSNPKHPSPQRPRQGAEDVYLLALAVPFAVEAHLRFGVDPMFLSVRTWRRHSVFKVGGGGGGVAVGLAVGVAVGVAVGAAVAGTVGADVGELVGGAVGAGVGACVGGAGIAANAFE